jgi:alanine racemase
MRYRPTVAEIDLDAIRSNVRAVKPADAELMTVVKADAYGHGAVPVARAALEAGATWLGVALVEEGLELREAGIEAPILVLSELPPGSEATAVEATLTPTVYSEAAIDRLASVARSRDIGVHLKVDTGMHRVGVYPPEAAGDLAKWIDAAGLRLEGLYTHLAKAEDDGPTTEQLERFSRAREAVAAHGGAPEILHAANSAGAIRRADARFDLVRVGIETYGLAPAPGVSTPGLTAAMSVRSEVSFAKRLPAGERISYGLDYELADAATIATVPIGYADGYRRAFSSVAEALLGGKRRRVAGAVTMDQLMLDCGNDAVESGDEVVLIGARDGERVTADELGEIAGTIGYEIVSVIGRRVPREYLGA